MHARFTATVTRQSNGTLELAPDKPGEISGLVAGDRIAVEADRIEPEVVESLGPRVVWQLDDMGAALAEEAATKRKK